MEAFGLVAVVSFFLFLSDHDLASDFSLNPATPELLMVPISGKSKTEVNLISYTRSSNESWQPLVDQLTDFLAVYNIDFYELNVRVLNCRFDEEKFKRAVCLPNIDAIYHRGCDPESSYGYNDGKPCVFLHLEKVLNWVPVSYNKSDLPSDMPIYLQQDVKEFSFDGQMIWLTCEGEDAADRENIGPLYILGLNGFPNFYFPFTDIRGYMSPFVAVKFENPKLHVTIKIECRVWAKNIEYNRSEHKGSIQFELLVD